jgi:hypothetical protein
MRSTARDGGGNTLNADDVNETRPSIKLDIVFGEDVGE